MMMTEGKSDFTKADIDNQVLVQMKLLGITLDKELNFSCVMYSGAQKSESSQLSFHVYGYTLYFHTILLLL